MIDRSDKQQAARNLIAALSSGDAKWQMSIPARPDNDSDLIIAAALDELESENAELLRAYEAQTKKLLELGWYMGSEDDGTPVWITTAQLEEAGQACKGAGE